jgi:hypothetical protein
MSLDINMHTEKRNRKKDIEIEAKRKKAREIVT